MPSSTAATSAGARVLARPRVGAPPAVRAPVPARWTLPNGLRVIAHPMHGTPQVAVRLVCPAGSVIDPAPYPGAASLVGALLTEGTRRCSADELHARLDLLGASIQASAGHDFAEIDGFFLSETIEDGLALFAEIASAPALSPAETERVRAESLDALVARADEPANVADDRLALEVFGAGHPYATPAFGTAEGIAAVPIEALHALHAAHYRPAGSFLVVAGDFDADALPVLLARAFGGWVGEAPRSKYPPPALRAAAAGRRIVVPWEDAAQSEIRVGGLGIERTGPHWIEAAVANYIVGGSTITGRLGANLREDKGWTYGARSAFAAGLTLSSWTAEAAVDEEVANAAVAEICGELRRLVSEEVPEDELRRARDALILSLPRAFETPARVISRLVTVEAFGLQQDYWETFPACVAAVSAQAVRAVARRCFDPAALVTVVVGGMAEEGAAGRRRLA